MTIPATALATAVEIEADRFQNLKYDEPSFQKEARAVLGEYNKSASSPFLKLNETMQNTAYTTHTYKHTTIGFLADIKDMPNQYAYSKVFFDRWYRPENCTIIVAGDVKHDDAGRRSSSSTTAAGSAARRRSRFPPSRRRPSRDRRALTWPLPTLPTLYLGYHIPAARSRESRHGRARRAGAGGLRRDQPALPGAGAQGTEGRDAVGRGRAEARSRASSRSWCGCGSRKTCPSSGRGSPRPWPKPPRRRSIRLGWTRSSRTCATRSPARFRPPTPSPMRSARPIATTGRPESINELFAAYDRLTPADLQRVAAKYFQPGNETADHPRDGDQEMTRSQHRSPRRWPGAAARGRDALATAQPRRPTSTKASSPLETTVAVALAVQPAGRVSIRAPGRLAERPAGQGRPGRPDRRDGRRRGHASRSPTTSFWQRSTRWPPLSTGPATRKSPSSRASIHRDNLGAYIPLATEMITQPRFAPEDFERLRNEALDYVTKYLRGNNDEELGKWTLQVELYKDHPYGHPDRGTAQGLKAITLDDVKAFHRRHYTREALKLGLAGGFDRRDAQRCSRTSSASSHSRLSNYPRCPLPRMPKGLEVTIVEKPADATAISIGFPIDVTRRDDDFYALAVANSYLGEHRTFNGKLMQDLRGKRGLNYGDYSYIEDFIQEGMSTFPVPNNPRRQQYFSIWIRPVPADKAVFALRAALWELDRLVERGMSQQDFEATRAFLLNYSKLWVQTLSRRLGYAIDGEFLRPQRPGHRAGRAASQADGRPGQRGRPQAPEDRRDEGRHRRQRRRRRCASCSPRANPRRSPTTPREPPRTSLPRTSRSPASRSRTCRCGSCRSSRCLRNSGRSPDAVEPRLLARLPDSTSRLLPPSSRLRLMLPPPMEPEILRRVLADQPLEGRREPLGEHADVVGRAGKLGGIDHVFAADLVAEARPDPPRDADDDGRLVLDRQQRDRLVGRGGPAEEIDVKPALAGVLVGQERECAVVLQAPRPSGRSRRSWGSATGRSARGTSGGSARDRDCRASGRPKRSESRTCRRCSRPAPSCRSGRSGRSAAVRRS